MKNYAIAIGAMILAVVVALWVVNARVAQAPGGGGSILPYNSGVRGTVSLGPTCPVERIPPDPACADKPYATTIVVRRTGASATFASGQSSAGGTFSFSLPPGNYTLTASGGTMLPRCTPVDASVGPAGYVTVNISCDTGIR